VGDYVGGYQDWLRQRRTPPATPASKAKPKQSAARAQRPAQKPKRSYKVQRELEALPKQIEVLEKEQAGIEQQVASPDFYRRDKAAVAEVMSRLESVQKELHQAYERWAALEG
jgi:ATP-binding cassette subfamily F protein uup